MRRLYPDPIGTVDPESTYGVDRALRAGRPWVMLNMISSADGAATVSGRSGQLGGASDREVFRALRSLADIILVAAGTVRAEGYGPPRLDASARRARHARGQEELPRIAIVTGSLALEWNAPLFATDPPPIVLTGADAPSGPRARAEEVAEVVEVGDAGVDLDRALAELGRRGAGVVLCEGGPRLNGQLLGLGLVDELNLTLGPLLVGADAPRIVRGAPGAEPLELELAHVLEDRGYLFLRYLRGGA